MKKAIVKPAVGALALTLASAPSLVCAQQASDLAVLRAEVEALEARAEAARQRVEELEARLLRLEAQPVSPDELVTIRGRYVPDRSIARSVDPTLGYWQDRGVPRELWAMPGSGLTQVREQVEAVAGADPIEGDDQDRKAPAPTDAVEDIQEAQQGRFGSSASLELGFGYTHFDNARINLDGFLALDAIFLGTISIDEVTADIFTVDPTLRVGIGENLFVDGGIPYFYRTSNFRSGGAGGSASAEIEETVHDSGFGDASFGASYKFMRETANRPDLVASARVRVPTGRSPFGVDFVEVANSEGNLQVPESLSTGSGVWGASLGVSALKTIDPMVVFGSATYFRNFERDLADIDENPGDQPGRVDVGDAYQLGAGLAFALNDKSSISMSYTQRVVERSRLRLDGQDELRRVVGSQANVGLVNLGATFSLGSALSLITTVGVGLTDDSPDMSINIRLPYRF